MIPVLYDANETEFTNQGIGSLAETISCVAYNEINGDYYIELKYPVKGIRYNDISLRKIIVADADNKLKRQAYRIFNITEPFNGIITITAKHITFDLTGIPLSPCEANNVSQALECFTTYAAVPHNFIFVTDRTTESEWYRDYPSSIRNAMGGSQGSILDVFSGEWEFDNFQCKLYTRLGTNRGVTISYGKNLTDFEQEKNCEEVYTGVYPYWSDNDLIYVELPEKIVSTPGTYDHERILVLDCGEYFQEEPSVEDLRERTERYISDNEVGIPKVTIKVKFQSFENIPEYHDVKLLETVCLGDTVSIRFPMYNVQATSRVRSSKYNVLLDRYDEISLGNAKTNLSDTIASNVVDIKNQPTVVEGIVERSIGTAAARITGNLGGYVRFMYDADGHPYELVISDKEDLLEAENVWRFNQEGWAHSSNGYYTSDPHDWNVAVTQNGELDASKIVVMNLVADLIHGGTLKLGGAEGETDFGSGGVFELRDSSNKLIGQMDVNGLKMYGDDGSYVLINNEVGFAGYDQNGTKIYWAAQSEFHMRQAVVEDEITFSGKMRFIPIEDATLGIDGIGLVTVNN